ncbi:hypothetical protein FAM09_28780 [Niastella caeni]|uniref:Uncharacterized protein n=1 Tax=Niastella caeni TaxID=2569763 RepID=A0A4S8H9P7_9BACT|nr:hypothetical protein [Niastella caeni]THU31620.1 hypothetical protein FAM09_28780 [Niastella caeni]
MKIKTGKEEIVYLLTKVVEKYEQTTGHKITLNTNRKNYEDLAKLLSDISNELPHTAHILNHEKYPASLNTEKLEYPYRKYDITGGQIKDAYNGIVASPRPFLVDACYIYLFGTGRKGFEENPVDEGLLVTEFSPGNELETYKKEQETLKARISRYEMERETLLTQNRSKFTKQKRALLALLFALLAVSFFTTYKWLRLKNEWSMVKKDMNVLPYQPTQAEIDSLEGIWLCYTGSPQARSSDPNRFHQVVFNVVHIEYKDGYFIYNRYGANFNHTGYAQYEAPYLVSLHSHIKNNTGAIESPRHSLMQLNKETRFIPIISASWNFDVGSLNNIVGIREVYVKEGKGGTIEEVINTVENASCKCKIVNWHQANGSVKTFYLKNQMLDNLREATLKNLLDEKSIILREPQEGVILSADTSHK